MRLCLLFPLLLAVTSRVLGDNAPGSEVTPRLVEGWVDPGVDKIDARLNEFYKDDIFNATQGDAAGGPDVTCHDHKEGDFGMFCPKDHAFMKDVWDTAVDIFCDQYKWKFIMPTGQWYRTKLVGFPCGSVEADNKGKHCDFAGVIRMDRDTNRGNEAKGFNFMDYGRCHQYSSYIWDKCGGQGGRTNTPWGTMFMYCTT